MNLHLREQVAFLFQVSHPHLVLHFGLFQRLLELGKHTPLGLLVYLTHFNGLVVVEISFIQQQVIEQSALTLHLHFVPFCISTGLIFSKEGDRGQIEGQWFFMDIFLSESFAIHDGGGRIELLLELSVVALQQLNSIVSHHVVSHCLPLETLAFEHLLEVSVHLQLALVLVVVKS